MKKIKIIKIQNKDLELLQQLSECRDILRKLLGCDTTESKGMSNGTV